MRPAALAACIACGPLTTHTLEHGGRERAYHLFVPDSAQPDAPLVLALHGGGGRGEHLDRQTRHGLTREAEKLGWVVVFPDGVEKGWNDGRTLSSRRDRLRAGVDDVDFLLSLVDHLAEEGTVDPDRVFATGISNGGFMSIRLALDAPGRVRAIAPVTAQLAEVHRDRTPASLPSLLVVNGTDDPLVPYEGGPITVFGKERGDILSTRATLDWWGSHLGCTDAVTERRIPDRVQDGTTSTMLRRTDCPDGAEVSLLRVTGGGHTWPGGSQYLPPRVVGVASEDVDGSRLIFRFFDRHAE